MLKKKLKVIADRFEDRLRYLFGKMTRDGRILLVLSVFVIFCGISIYTTFSTVYSFGKRSGQKQMKIEHINRLELERINKLDSINTLKQKDNE